MKNIFNQFLGTAVFSASLLFSGNVYSLDDLGREEGSVEYSIDSKEVEAVLKVAQELGANFLQKVEETNPGFNSDINRVMSYLENPESVSREEMLSAVVNIMNVVQAEQLQRDAVQVEKLQLQLQQKDAASSKKLKEAINLWNKDKESLEGRVVNLESLNKNIRMQIENYSRSGWPVATRWIAFIAAIIIFIYILQRTTK